MIIGVGLTYPREKLAWLEGQVPLILLAVTFAALAAGGILQLAGAAGAGDAAWLAAGACGAAYALWAMADALRRGRAGVDAIALLALLGAMAVGELLAAAVISVMLASGRALEAWAAGRADRDLRALLERAPRTARRYSGGSLVVVPLDAVGAGDLLMVAPGELVPVDGTLAASPAVLDESALTGEPRPVERASGELVRSGVVNAGGPFDLRAAATAQDSTYAGIVRLVSEAERSQAPFVRLADRYALWFLGVTLTAAGIAWALAGPARAVAVLVVATPCPLILAAPVALVSGLSVAARRGVVVKGGAVLERLARCTTVLIDKTGQLTSGHPSVAGVITAGPLPARDVLRLAASLDQVSQHVLAGAVVRAAARERCELVRPDDVQEVPGQGIRGTVGGHQVAVGKAAWAGVSGAPAWAKMARRRARLDGALTVFVAADGAPAGVLLMEDPVRPDACRTPRARSGGSTASSWSPATAPGRRHGGPDRRRRGARRPQPATNSTRSTPRRAARRPSWSATASTTRPRWPSRTWVSRWEPGEPPPRRRPPTRCSPWTTSTASARWPRSPAAPSGSPGRAWSPGWASRSPRWAWPRPACCPRSGARCCKRLIDVAVILKRCACCTPPPRASASPTRTPRSPGGSRRSTSASGPASGSCGPPRTRSDPPLRPRRCSRSAG